MRILFLSLLLCSCMQAQQSETPKQDLIEKTEVLPKKSLNSNGMSPNTRILVPDGFERVDYPESSFSFFLQNSPLKAATAKVMLFNGEEKRTQTVHVAVLDIDVGERDLQQCADAVMRLRAEYLWRANQFEDIHFNFTNGFRADYPKWRSGYRIRVDGNKVSWVKHRDSATSYQAFRKYLDMVFAYAGTRSLAKELQVQTLSEMEVGDVFIQGGSPGHAVLVIDKAIHKETGEVLFCLAQSYMPAQDIHILKNPMDAILSPWYAVKAIETALITPEWTFYKEDLKRF